MPRLVISAVILVLALMLQMFFAKAAPGLALDFLLLPVVFMAVVRGGDAGARWGFVCGMVQDLAGGSVLGAHAFGKALAGGLLGRLPHRFDRRSPTFQAAATAAGSLVAGCGAAVVRTLVGAGGSLLGGGAGAVARALLAGVVTSAVLGPAGFWALSRLTGRRYRAGEGKWRFYA